MATGETRTPKLKLRSTQLVVLIYWSLIAVAGAATTTSLISEEGQQQQQPIGASIFIPPSPSLKTAPINSTANLSCGITTSSRGDYTWTKDGITLPGKRGRDLVVQPVAKGDAGKYRCHLELESGVVFSPSIELVVVALEATTNNQTISTPLNGNLLLPCGINSTPSIATEYSWRRNGIQIDQTAQLNYLPLPPQFGGGLIIKNVGQSFDGDVFSCTASNLLLNKSITTFTRLQIQENPPPQKLEILPTFPPQIKLQEAPLTLICAANNPLATVNWVLSDSDVAMETTTNLTPEIDLSWYNSSGDYTCTANYNGRTVTKTTTTTHPPLPFPPLPPLLKYPAAKTVRYECRTGLSEISWFKNGELLPPNKGRFKMKGAELLISNTIQSDSGFYQCESGGRVGWGQLVIVGGVGGAPVEVACSGVTQRGIRVEWGMGGGQDGGGGGGAAGGIHAFTIHYMPTDGGEERQHVTTNNYWLLDALQPNTNYSIYVRSYSDRSASGQSERVYCKTKLGEGEGGGGPPSAPPVNTSHSIVNGSLVIRWGEPGKTGVVKGYTIEIRNKLTGVATTTTTATANTSTTIRGLAPNTEYEYRLAAVTGEGVVGEFTPFIRFKILKRREEMVGDGPQKKNKESSQDSSGGVSEQQMGAIFGSILAVMSVLIAMVIIVFRNRCFAYMAGSGGRQASNIRGGGKDSVDGGGGGGATSIEMKILNTSNSTEGGVLDTKGRHANSSSSAAAVVPNGIIVQNSEDLEQREPLLLVGGGQQPSAGSSSRPNTIHPIEEEQPP